MPRRITRGRQKIEIKKIERDEDRMITFSKRRQGIYKKLSELVTLCGSEVGFLTFSKAGTPFTFGHRSFQEVARLYMSGDMNPAIMLQNDNAAMLMEAQQKSRINGFNEEFTKLMEKLEEEKEIEKTTKNFAGNSCRSSNEKWWKEPISEIYDLEKLKRLQLMFKELHDGLIAKVVERTIKASNAAGPSSSSSNILPPNIFPGYEMNQFGSNNPANQDANPGSSYPPDQGFTGWQF